MRVSLRTESGHLIPGFRNAACAVVTLVAVGLAGVGLAGCSGSAKIESKSPPPTSSTEDVASVPECALNTANRCYRIDLPDIVGFVVRSGVHCGDELVGEVGKTVTCEAPLRADFTGNAIITHPIYTPSMFADPNKWDLEVNAILTVTKVAGGMAKFDISPELTKEQLERGLTKVMSAQSVSCSAGLAGERGAMTTCSITKDGNTSDKTITVTKIRGWLLMDLSLT